MKNFDIKEITKKLNQKFEGNVNVGYSSYNWTSKKTLWGTCERTNKWADTLVFCIEIDPDKNSIHTLINDINCKNFLSLESNNNKNCKDKKIIERDFQVIFSKLMDKEPVCMYYGFLGIKSTSFMFWADNEKDAESFLEELIKNKSEKHFSKYNNSSHLENSVHCIKYNKNYGSKKLERLCSQSDAQVEIVDFRKLYFNHVLNAGLEPER